MNDDFYVEDETPDEVRAAWRRGEKGHTKGRRDLNKRAKAIVDRAVLELGAVTIKPAEGSSAVETQEVDATTWFAPPGSEASEAHAGETVKTDEAPVHAYSRS